MAIWVKEVSAWFARASDITLLLVFLCLSAGTIAIVTVFFLRKHLPMRWNGDKDEHDVPLLSRDWFNKQEKRGEKIHDIAGKVGILEMSKLKWDDAVVATETNAQEIGLLRTRIEQVAVRVHEFSGRAGEIEQLSERMDSLENRHEGHMVEASKQTGEFGSLKVGVARLEEQMKGVKDSTDRIERNVEKLADRFFGPLDSRP